MWKVEVDVDDEGWKLVGFARQPQSLVRGTPSNLQLDMNTSFRNGEEKYKVTNSKRTRRNCSTESMYSLLLFEETAQISRGFKFDYL